MAGRLRSEPMRVKYWTRAGIMLTDWCNAACACCYANCSPQGQRWMTAEQAVKVWESLTAASPHGCRVHLTGGEPFGRFDLLLEVCRRGQQLGLVLESVETNAFWAQDDATVADRLRALDAAGMGRIAISADPYHQQFVPIDRPRRLARVAGEVLGPQRVKVRWEDWLREGHDMLQQSPESAREILNAYAASGRDRIIGRAAEALSGEIALKLPEPLVDKNCGDRLLRGRHVHVAPSGEVWPATCVGISIGNALTRECTELWNHLDQRFQAMPVIAALCEKGPEGLRELAGEFDFVGGGSRFLSKCYLCYQLRRQLLLAGRLQEYLAPAEAYGLIQK